MAATAPLNCTLSAAWPTFFAQARLVRLVRLGVNAGRLTPDEARACAHLDEVPAEPPARLHGDLWGGNLLWAEDGRVWLVDAAAAHAGHRETDLALLHLFGAPHLDAVAAGYSAVAPPAVGWEGRLGVHQLHPLLLHAVPFGDGCGAEAAEVARRYL